MSGMWASKGLRYAITGLCLVVVFSIVSPAVGGPNPVRIAKKALSKSKKALSQAQQAHKTAKEASSAADGAAGEAALAQGQNVSGHDSVLSFGPIDDQGAKVAEVELTTATETRILASASTVVGNDADDATICWLNAGGAPNDSANDISQRVFSDAGNGVLDFQALSVNGSVVKPAGTHTISLYCGATLGDPVVDRIDLLAWASAP
jgi:hypothetical protein